MKFQKTICLLFALIWSGHFSVMAQNPEVSKIIELLENKEYNLQNELKVYADETKKLTAKQILNFEENKFQTVSTDLPTDATHWAKVKIKNTSKDTSWVISVWEMYLDIYLTQNQKVITHLKAGTIRAQNESDAFVHNGALLLQLVPNQTYTLLIQISSIDAKPPGWNVHLQPKKMFLELQKEKPIEYFLIQGLFQGMIWIIIIYNLLVYIQLKEKSYLHYAHYLFWVSLYFVYRRGLISVFMSIETPYIFTVIWLFCVGGVSASYFLFTRSFFDLKYTLPKLGKTLLYWAGIKFIILVLVIILIHFFNEIVFLIKIGSIVGALEIVGSLVILYIVMKHFPKIAFYFVIGNMGLLLISLIYVVQLGLYWYGIMERSDTLMQLILQFGVIFEMVFFSLGLGYRMRLNEQERREAQDKLIQQLRQNEELQQAYTEDLERKVTERTQELTLKTHDLEEKNEEVLQQNEEITLQKSLIENKNKDITASINYAKRIQEAMLPALQEIKNSLPESFVFFRPRDIVSGDFYWFSEVQNLKIIAAVDCTGHGVPGAFMSMIGNDLLNEIVNIRGFTRPDLILKALHLGVTNALKQNENYNRDGMDLALCVIDSENRKIEFSGAKNPLIYIQNNEAIRIKGSRMPIGGWDAESAENQHFFETKIIELTEKPTPFFIFSDGYPDQFGGKHEKKFMMKRFRGLLTEIAHETPDQQTKILTETLDNWQNPEPHIQHPQIDDILVIGFKV